MADLVSAPNSRALEAELEMKLKECLRCHGDDHWFTIKEDLFAVPYLDGFLLYSPLQGVLVLITRTGLANLLLHPSAPISACLSECTITRDMDLIRLLDVKPKQRPCTGVDPDEEFIPTNLTLSPTSACQMSCIYCYIHGGDKPRHMSWELAEAALRTTFANCLHTGRRTFEVEFHGQGEPTANWPLLTQAILFAEQMCKSESLEATFSVVTNGMLTSDKISFLAHHRVNIGLSMDGLQSTMALQRPLRNGMSSFDVVMQTIGGLEQKGLECCIRGTVTSLCVEEMQAFAAFLLENTRCRYVNFEPVCETGRARDSGLAGPGFMAQFLSHFREASDFARKRHMYVGLSSCRLDGLRSSFCSAYGPNLNFCVSTEGLVSSCYEVLEMSDPRAELFIYGRYDPSSASFVLDPDKVQRLRSLDVTQMRRCADCFVKWNCGGDCIAKAALGGLDKVTGSTPLERCHVTRSITADELIETLFAAPAVEGGDPA